MCRSTRHRAHCQLHLKPCAFNALPVHARPRLCAAGAQKVMWGSACHKCRTKANRRRLLETTAGVTAIATTARLLGAQAGRWAHFVSQIHVYLALKVLLRLLRLLAASSCPLACVVDSCILCEYLKRAICSRRHWLEWHQHHLRTCNMLL